MPGIVLGAGEAAVNKTKSGPCRVYSLVGREAGETCDRQVNL